MSGAQRGPADWGYNLIGFLTGEFGLGVAARNTLHALECRGENVARIDVGASAGKREVDASAASKAGPERLPVNLFHLNPNEIRIVGAAAFKTLEPASRFNIAVPFWELPRLPLHGWTGVLGAMDVLLAPSHYIRGALEEGLPGSRVLHYPQAVFIPEGAAPDRQRFGLPPNATVFYMNMDASSDLVRKNPAGAIEAFLQAFPAQEDAMLAIRVSNTAHSRETREAYERLSHVAAADRRVRVFEQPMSYSEMLSLSASSDAYVSLHRSEGLGLNIMEAMSVGKPAIVTAWSGNMDFTDSENALLVEYDLVPVKATHPAYAAEAIGPGQAWAEPRLASAVRLMREIHDQRERAAELGIAAAAAMESRRTSFERGEVFDRVHALYAEVATARFADPLRADALRHALHDTSWQRLRRVAGRALRRAGAR